MTAGPHPGPRPAGPLAGRVALVTGVSRRVGIGMAVARRLAGLGADLFVTSWTAHDREQPWGADPGGIEAVLAELRAGPTRPPARRPPPATRSSGGSSTWRPTSSTRTRPTR